MLFSETEVTLADRVGDGTRFSLFPIPGSQAGTPDLDFCHGCFHFQLPFSPMSSIPLLMEINLRLSLASLLWASRACGNTGHPDDSQLCVRVSHGTVNTKIHVPFPCPPTPCRSPTAGPVFVEWMYDGPTRSHSLLDQGLPCGLCPA